MITSHPVNQNRRALGITVAIAVTWAMAGLAPSLLPVDWVKRTFTLPKP